MRQVVLESTAPRFTWIDVMAPERDELVALAKEFGFHAMSVEDCLDPWHLPKQERFGETTFVILRVYDDRAKPGARTVQELTRKIAIFYRADLVVTIHRADLPMVAAIRDRCAAGDAPKAPHTLLGRLFNGALDSFDPPLDKADEEVDALEDQLFTSRRRSPKLVAIHDLKRRVNVIKRLFWQTNVVMQRLEPPTEKAEVVFQDVKENAESYFFYADELLDQINSLLGIHVAIGSQRTNEVMRVLTVFSAFFLPLTFIVGIYGMNFVHMPELAKEWGYPAVLIMMAGVAGAIALWFRRRGWLGRGPD